MKDFILTHSFRGFKSMAGGSVIWGLWWDRTSWQGEDHGTWLFISRWLKAETERNRDPLYPLKACCSDLLLPANPHLLMFSFPVVPETGNHTFSTWPLVDNSDPNHYTFLFCDSPHWPWTWDLLPHQEFGSLQSAVPSSYIFWSTLLHRQTVSFYWV
jgi:hypothetical protein